MRVREYTGQRIGVQLSPNTARTLAERHYLMEVLRDHFDAALSSGNYELSSKPKTALRPNCPKLGETKYTLSLALENKRSQHLAPKYLKNLQLLLDAFLSFLTERERSGDLAKLPEERITEFLQQYNTSATYFMNKRRHLKVLLSEAERISKVVIPGSRSIPRAKPKPKAHVPYSENQLKSVLHYLRLHDSKMYLCALLCYGCWLRPHNEIRQLRVENIREGAQKIVLNADQNKSGRIRSVPVPEEIREVLLRTISGLSTGDNIFSKTPDPYDPDYFNRKWQRSRSKMVSLGILEPGHTIYSFRHTAAINLYRNTKDIGLLQRIMDHTEVTTTMTYLRGLGELNESDWQQASPTLNII